MTHTLRNNAAQAFQLSITRLRYEIVQGASGPLCITRL